MSVGVDASLTVLTETELAVNNTDVDGTAVVDTPDTELDETPELLGTLIDVVLPLVVVSAEGFRARVEVLSLDVTDCVLDSVLPPVCDVEVRTELVAVPPASVFTPGIDPDVLVTPGDDTDVTGAVVLEGVLLSEILDDAEP